jgi:hypothetical protein
MCAMFSHFLPLCEGAQYFHYQYTIKCLHLCLLCSVHHKLLTSVPSLFIHGCKEEDIYVFHFNYFI